MISRLREGIVLWLSRIANVVLLFYCRFNSKVYTRGVGAVFVSDVKGCERFGFGDLRGGKSGGLKSVVAFVSSVAGAEFLLSDKSLLEQCAVVYAWGSDVKGVLGSSGFFGQRMGGAGLGVWSPVDVVPFEVKPVYVFFFWVSFWVLCFYVGYFFPMDDLLRHSVSYKWGYDYNLPYFDSVYRTHFDMYIGFDVIVGWLHRLFGKGALLVSQLFSLSLTFLATNRMLRGASNNLKSLVLLLMLVILAPRFVLGRPSLACSSIMLCLIAYREVLPVALRVFLGAAMAPLYYLFWIYFVPLVVFERKHLVGFAAGLVFWVAYSHGLYFSEIWNVVGEMSMRNMRITENATIGGFLVSHFVFCIPFVLYMGRDWRSALSAVLLSLTNQVRYVETVLPLLLSFFRFVEVRVSSIVVVGLVMFSVTLPKYKVDSFDHEAIGKLIPSGSRVMSDEMPTAYQLVFWDSSLRVAPHYGYGLTPKDTQALFADLADGKVDCSNKAIGKFDYLIERSVKGIAPSCLELVGVAADRRVWKFK